MKRLFLALPLLVSSCGPYMTDGDYYWVHRAGADMPVWVRGNVDSGVFLVTLHGGPGHNGQGMILSRSFQELEESYAVVYWDQRASGMSQGNPSTDTFTIADFVADTDAVLGVVEEVYAPESLFVLGHSWGGDLALATALDGEMRNHVDGWVLHAAAHDEWMALDASRAWMMDQIETYVDEGVDAGFWAAVGDWYRENPGLPPSDARHWSFVSRTTGYYYNPENYEPPPIAELALASPFTMALYQNEARSARLAEPLLDNFDVSDRLDELEAPTLVLTGEHDGAVPSVVAEEIYAGLPDGGKEFVEFPGVAHSAHDEDPDAFVVVLTDFIERHR